MSAMQRSRMLSSAVGVVSEFGYAKMSVARVTGRARVSRRTFYDFFEDREDCFLAVFDDGVEQVSALVVGAYGREQDGVWCEKVRAALQAFLVFFDEEPAMASLLVVDALRAGPRVLERRAEVLGRLGAVLHRDALTPRPARELSAMTGEGVVGAVLGVIHTRLLQRDPGSLVELLNPLMAMAVSPYLGRVAAQRELERPAPEIAPPSGTSRGANGSVDDPLAGLGMRVTYRTLRVLGAIAELGRQGACPSNRGVADVAGVSDQGQMSKLLGRLERLGLIENATADPDQRSQRPTGEPNAWRLTARGEQVQRSIPACSDRAERQVHGEREALR